MQRSLAALLLLAVAARAETSPQASKAISKAQQATDAMYGWWCAKDGANKPLCQRNALLTKLRTAAAAEKPGLMAQLKKVGTTGITKEYLEMKQRFCATPPGKAFTLCQQPTRSYNTSRRVKRDNSSTLMYTWLCAKEGLSPAQRGLCTRNELTEKLKALSSSAASSSSSSSSSSSRESIVKELRTTPFNSVAYQAVTAEYCALGRGANMDSLICRSVKQNKEGKELTSWYCTPAASSDAAASKPWCEMTGLYAQLKEVPPTDAAARKPILQKIIELRKRAGKAISEEYSTAVKKFCVGRETYDVCKPEEDSYDYDSYDGR